MTAPQLDLEEQNAILGSVTTLLVQRLRGDWEQLFVDFRMVGRYLEAEATGLTIYGSSFRWRLPDEALPFFVQLREGMARPGGGTWLSVKFHLVHPDTYSAEFNRDAEPDWTSPPNPEHYAQELELHPRDEVPGWLAAKAGLPEPATEPAAAEPTAGTTAAEPAGTAAGTAGTEAAESAAAGTAAETAAAESSEPPTAQIPAQSPAASPAAPLVAAPLFDGLDAQGVPTFADRPRPHPQELDDVLAYLEGAPVVLAARSYGKDVFKPDAAPGVPLSFHTDGTWVWPGGVGYYLRHHHVPPVPQLVQHIRDNGYAVPPVSPDARAAATAVASGQAESAPLPAYAPRVVTDADRRALEQLKARLDHFGVAEHEYGLVEPRPDALVLEPAPGPSGWQVQFWDSSRGPHGRPRVYEHAVDAAKVLLAELLWRDDRDAERAGGRAQVVQPVADIQPLPDEPPLSLFRDREAVVLPAGTELDRFGAENGNLVYVAGTVFGQRSLPPDWLNRRYHVYRVQQPVPAVKGVAVPWFGQAGGGTGYFLVASVRDLLADGRLVEIAEATAQPPGV
ncbi:MULTISPECIES: TNT domain-containing protein [unclassified Saccharothrix]|uniref:TNT domain-containing protein n=1 Tax=unclassified Saccharothrix TaxID=2593673 RepID=UPI00307D5E29